MDLFAGNDDAGEFPEWVAGVDAGDDAGTRERAANDIAAWLAAKLSPAVLCELPLAIGMLSAGTDAAGAVVPRFAELQTVIAWWNCLAADGAVSAGVRSGKISAEVSKAWKRFCREPELQEMLRDLPAVESAIRRSARLCGQGWFRLEKLLCGKNADGCYVLRKLLDGGYFDDEATNNGGPATGWDALAKFANG